MIPGLLRADRRPWLDRAARQRLGRSLSIRVVDAGSCNGCELEIHALSNAFYDLERFGLRFIASPRHADVPLVEPLDYNWRWTISVRPPIVEQIGFRLHPTDGKCVLCSLLLSTRTAASATCSA